MFIVEIELLNFIIFSFYLLDLQVFTTVKVSKVGDHSQGQLEGSLFNSYYTEV